MPRGSQISKEGLHWPVGEKVGGGAGSPWSCHRIFEVSPEFLLRIYLYWVSLRGGVGVAGHVIRLPAPPLGSTTEEHPPSFHLASPGEADGEVCGSGCQLDTQREV